MYIQCHICCVMCIQCRRMSLVGVVKLLYKYLFWLCWQGIRLFEMSNENSIKFQCYPMLKKIITIEDFW